MAVSGHLLKRFTGPLAFLRAESPACWKGHKMATKSRRTAAPPKSAPVRVYFVRPEALEFCKEFASEFDALEFEETANALEKSTPRGLIAVADVHGILADALAAKGGVR